MKESGNAINKFRLPVGWNLQQLWHCALYTHGTKECIDYKGVHKKVKMVELAIRNCNCPRA